MTAGASLRASVKTAFASFSLAPDSFWLSTACVSTCHGACTNSDPAAVLTAAAAAADDEGGGALGRDGLCKHRLGRAR